MSKLPLWRMAGREFFVFASSFILAQNEIYKKALTTPHLGRSERLFASLGFGHLLLLEGYVVGGTRPVFVEFLDRISKKSIHTKVPQLYPNIAHSSIRRTIPVAFISLSSCGFVD